MPAVGLPAVTDSLLRPDSTAGCSDARDKDLRFISKGKMTIRIESIRAAGWLAGPGTRRSRNQPCHLKFVWHTLCCI
jgi:hypothetical protein